VRTTVESSWYDAFRALLAVAHASKKAFAKSSTPSIPLRAFLISDIGLAVTRTIEGIACATDPKSATCRRIERLLNLNVSMPVRRKSVARDIRSAVEIARWDLTLPPLTSMPRDCYVLCGYDYDDLLTRSCLWDAASDDGVFRAVYDAIFLLKNSTCASLAPTDGSEHLINNIFLFNVSKMIFRRANITNSGSSSARLDAVTKIQNALTAVVRRITGTGSVVMSNDAIVEIIASAIGKYNTTEQMIIQGRDFIFNLNMEPLHGPVGLRYYIDFILPTFTNPDCKKVRGDYKVFGVFPWWNPAWLTAPAWLPDLIVGWLEASIRSDFIVNEKLLIDASGCRLAPDATPAFNLPFTEGSNCTPSFYNCAEVLAMKTPLDSLFFLLHWLVPSVAKSSVFRSVAVLFMVNDRLDAYNNIESHPDFDLHKFCFFFTAPGMAYIALTLPFIVGALATAAAIALTGISFVGTISFTGLVTIDSILRSDDGAIRRNIARSVEEEEEDIPDDEEESVGSRAASILRYRNRKHREHRE
jgi:hypothetical protein